MILDFTKRKPCHPLGKQGIKSIKSPPDIRLMPAKAKKPGDSG